MNSPQWLRNNTGRVKALCQNLVLVLLLALLWNVALPAMAGATYTDNGDGTVTDTSTGLMWKHCGEGQTWSGNTCSGRLRTYSWNQANALTNTVTFAGYSDWRLPSLSELGTLAAATTYTSAISSIDTTVFPNQITLFWSSTPDTSTPGNRMYVSFIYGNAGTITGSFSMAAHLVRVGSTADDSSATQSLVQGWNLLGNSRDQAITVSTLYGDPAEVAEVYGWDSANQRYRYYNPAMTAAENEDFNRVNGFDPAVLTEIQPGEAYLVHANVSKTLPPLSGNPVSLSADDLVPGANALSIADSISPAEFNRLLSSSNTPFGTNGTANNFTDLYAWDAPSSKWYYYSPSLDAQGGTVLSDYSASQGYLDFATNNKMLGDGIGFVVYKAEYDVGTLQFVSVTTNPVTTPTMITLRGTGGAGRSESARVTFRVLDSAGNPVGNTPVNFSLNTALGGLALTATSAISDPTTGQVSTYVQAGTMSTSVRVTASAGTLTAQSDQLYVSTGIAAQDSISLSASVHNIEGWNWDGETSDLTVRLADHFHNPVLDGTAVYFTSEGGAVTPACTTVDNACTVQFTSQNLRPTNGRITILARATGEEAFTDLNGNGTADSGEMIDANFNATDIGEAYLDYNEDGICDQTREPYIDFNGNGVYGGGDGKYNGQLCTSGSAICSPQKSIDVRTSTVIVLSSSSAVITINSGAAINLTASPSFTVNVVDRNGNAMPPDTTVEFATTNGTIDTEESYTYPDITGCNSHYSGCPASSGSATFGNHTVIMSRDDTPDSGTFTVTVTTPKGLITIATGTVID